MMAQVIFLQRIKSRLHHTYIFLAPIFSHIISKHLLSHFYGPYTVETRMNKNQTHSQKPLSLLGKRAGTLYTVSSTVKIWTCSHGNIGKRYLRNALICCSHGNEQESDGWCLMQTTQAGESHCRRSQCNIERHGVEKYLLVHEILFSLKSQKNLVSIGLW